MTYIPSTAASYEGGQSLDAPPASPTTWDDEFDDTTGNSGTVNGLNARWSWRNQTGGVTATYSFGQSFITLVNPSQSGDNIHCLEQTAPTAGSFEFATKLCAQCKLQNFFAAGLYLLVNASGKLMEFGPRYSSGVGGLGISVYKYTNVTTFSSTPLDLSSGVAPLSQQYYHVGYDGTNVYFGISYTGRPNDLVTLFSEAATTFLGARPDRVGIQINANGNGVTSRGIFDWFRRTV